MKNKVSLASAFVALFVALVIPVCAIQIAHADDGFGGSFGGDIDGFGNFFGGGDESFGGSFGGGYDGFGNSFGGGYDGFGNSFGGGNDGYGGSFGGEYDGFGNSFGGAYNGFGNEQIIGEDGNERIIGEFGNERIIGEYGDERIIGEHYDSECDCFGTDYDHDGVIEIYEETTHYDAACGCYSYGHGGGYSVGSKSFMPSFGGYSMVRPITIPAPNYPSYPSRPVGGGSVSNITNTTVTNTNIDNSINDSFNNYNSNNVVLQPATPQYPVVYTAPAPYCTITQAVASGSGVTAAYLSWHSTNATSAYLSNVGAVSVNGSQTVWPTANTTYTLTVYGNGGSATCAVTVNAAAPYVSLEQIPYTGFDFGTVGNAIYWTVLASFALAGGYLVYFYTGSTLSYAGAMVSNRKTYAPIVPAKASILAENKARSHAARMSGEAAVTKVEPIVAAIRKSGTTDSMAIVASKDGSMPKIVISRN